MNTNFGNPGKEYYDQKVKQRFESEFGEDDENFYKMHNLCYQGCTDYLSEFEQVIIDAFNAGMNYHVLWE